MAALRAFASRRPGLTGALLWVFAIFVTLACFTYQDKTGPTYPLEGDFQTARGVVRFQFLRSETIGTDLKIMLLEPVPDGVSGYVRYRRYQSDDEWTTVPFAPGSFAFSRRGSSMQVRGLGVELPWLKERAGKYEYYVYIDDGAGEPVSVTGEQAIYARYKGEVPAWALVLHILIIFASMALALRTVFAALADEKYHTLLRATILSLLLGAFVLGPLVQWYAFGVWWSGIPFGYDWTDNKVLVELVFWLLAAYFNRGGRRAHGWIYLAGLVTLVVYFIPHSIFGSEYNYRTGTGHGTAG